MPENLILASGREIKLCELWQATTYEGVLEGFPTSSINAGIVEWLRCNPKHWLQGYKPHVLAPRETPIKLRRPWPLGQPMLLPAITCVGRFESTSPTRPGPDDRSTLVVAWFQESFALPIDAEILEQLRQLDWSELATNSSW